MNNKLQTIPSYEIAEMMGKEHKEIMWMIEGNEKRGIVGIKPTIEISAELHLSDYFIKSSYKDSMNREKSSYECTKMGCEMLANKLTGEKGILFTARYVNKFNKMEQCLKEQNRPSYMLEDPVERAKRWIFEYQEKEKLAIENKKHIEIIQKQSDAIQELAPKADYFDALVDRNLLTNIRDTAKEFKIREKEFTAWLLQKKICYRDKKRKIKPYANKMEYFEMKEFTTIWGHSDTQTLITPKGRETFRLLLIRDGLIKDDKQLTYL